MWAVLLNKKSIYRTPVENYTEAEKIAKEAALTGNHKKISIVSMHEYAIVKIIATVKLEKTFE